jgi:hypothetical protein
MEYSKLHSKYMPGENKEKHKFSKQKNKPPKSKSQGLSNKDQEWDHNITMVHFFLNHLIPPN